MGTVISADRFDDVEINWAWEDVHGKENDRLRTVINMMGIGGC